MKRRTLRSVISLLLLAVLVLIVVVGAGAQEETPTTEPDPTATASPEPEPTPSLSLNLGEDLADAAASFSLEDLEPIDLLRMVVSIAVVVLFLLFGRRLVTRILRRLTERTHTKFDDELVDRLQRHIRWFVGVVGFDIGFSLLFFGNISVTNLLRGIFFWFYYVIVFSAAYTTISFFFDWYEQELHRDEEEPKVAVFLPILKRFSMILLIVLAAAILLDHFGINVTGLAAAAAIVGFAVALAAQDMIGDLISGYVILIDRPFRVGDRIDIPGQGIWGDVTEIGTRTTRIRTRDNNLVIMPNSDLADGQILNYSYPDPVYRLQTDLGIGYGEDLKQVRQALEDAVRGVEGVLENHPVQVLFLEFADSWMSVRVRWWIDTYADKRVMQDRVNSALQDAIEGHEIEAPYPIQTLEVKLDEEN